MASHLFCIVMCAHGARIRYQGGCAGGRKGANLGSFRVALRDLVPDSVHRVGHRLGKLSATAGNLEGATGSFDVAGIISGRSQPRSL